MKDLGRTLGTQWHKDKLPRNWKRIDLQARDIRLLKTLIEQKFLSWEQIRDYLFDGKGPYAYSRLWKLRRFDFVRRLGAAYTRHDLYLPTALAHESFHEQFIGITPFTLPDPEGVSHDLLMTDIRFLFERIGFGNSWTSERVWRINHPEAKVPPDALFHIGRDPFFLKVELGRKRDYEYRNIFSGLRENFGFAGCLFVTTEGQLNIAMEEGRQYRWIYFTTAAELFEKKEKAVFQTAECKTKENDKPKATWLVIEENLEKHFNKPPSS